MKRTVPRVCDLQNANCRIRSALFTLLSVFVFSLFLGAPVWAQDEEDDEFVITFLKGDAQLNPIYSYTSTEAQIYTALYEGLVSYHPLTMEPVPAVAERWDVSDDGLVYTFHLRPEARYWNGDPVRPEDFRETWLKLIAPETGASYNFLFDVIDGARAYRTGADSDPASVGIVVRDNRTLEVRLHRPATHFLKILCHHSFVPVHPSVRERRDWSELSTVPSNGPYYITSRSGDEIVLTRNELYWAADLVQIPRMRFLFLDEEADATKLFNDGTAHWVTSGINFEAVATRSAIIINPLFATTYFFVKADEAPFSDPRVRRALALLVPWQHIRSEEFQFIPADTLVPQIPFYPEVERITEPNVDEALALLEEAGYRRGVRLPTITLFVPQGQENARIAGILTEAWETALEVSVDIVAGSYPGYFDALRSEEYTVGTVSWIGDFADPMTFLQMWISGSNVNSAGFADSRYDDLIDESMTQTGEERYRTLGMAEEILLGTGTVLPVSHSPAINLIDLDVVEGWFPNPLDIHPVRYFRFAEYAPIPGVINYDVPGDRVPSLSNGSDATEL